MSLRTFTVFQDAPSIETPKLKVTRPTAMAIRSSSLNEAIITSSNSLVDVTEVTDKENYHPVTGERAGPGSNNTAKKRKTNVLATKVHTPGSAAKKKKDSSHTDSKKHKASTSSTTKAKVASKRDGKAKKTYIKKPPSRKVSPMPKVNEEEEQVVADKGPEHLTQADIDSRCYELTVKPLADVSEAYEQVVDNGALNESDAKLKFCSVKEPSAEPEIRDYFSPTLSTSRPSHPRDTSEEPRAFSTPERKRIYVAFTFSSPSPTSARFRQSRSGSVSPE
ncbi:hypothetical protein K443DRAFT_674369 [Laccaria amethystina LaAM-08-1]|uniref:Uncharacterized protein n=1 Tax=Laccaria amethystina LaAM-08-1 TaxID=1095629 RepID=A0A0C9X2N0_9AGAR|nr:hypothetical protein K443DRAFT_674369 [Laccaria amethystina LaAM-08-1]